MEKPVIRFLGLSWSKLICVIPTLESPCRISGWEKDSIHDLSSDWSICATAWWTLSRELMSWVPICRSQAPLSVDRNQGTLEPMVPFSMCSRTSLPFMWQNLRPHDGWVRYLAYLRSTSMSNPLCYASGDR